MQKYLFGGAAALALLMAGAMVSSQQVQIAHAEQANGIVNIRAIEAAIDVNALPVMDIKDTI
jgi:hypothetical protein